MFNARIDPTPDMDYDWLLDGLDESRERLRIMDDVGEQQSVDIAKAFYRLDCAAAAIRDLLAQRENQGRRKGLALL